MQRIWGSVDGKDEDRGLIYYLAAWPRAITRCGDFPRKPRLCYKTEILSFSVQDLTLGLASSRCLIHERVCE